MIGILLTPTVTTEIRPLDSASAIIKLCDSDTMLKRKEEIGSPCLNPLWILNGSEGYNHSQ